MAYHYFKTTRLNLFTLYLNKATFCYFSLCVIMSCEHEGKVTEHCIAINYYLTCAHVMHCKGGHA